MPVRTYSLANQRTHWAEAARRARVQRAAGFYMTLTWRLKTVPRIIITLTRIGPRMLDAHDGLPISMKHVVDGICDRLKTDDADPRLTFRYEQEKAKTYGVRIRIEAGT